MKMSVKFMLAPSRRRDSSGPLGSRNGPRLLFLWSRVRTVRRLDGVVDDDRRAILELDLTAGYHLVAALDAFEDSDLVATRRTRRDEDLLRGQDRVALAVLLVRGLDHEHGASVRVVGEHGLRQREIALLLARVHLDRREHAGQKLSLGIGYRGFDLHIASVRIDPGIDRIDLALEAHAGKAVGGEGDLLSQPYLRQLLLRQVEVDVNGVDRLQGHDLVAGIEILARVDRRDPQLPRERGANLFLLDHRGLL